MSKNKRHHFVPQFYLRQFRIDDSESIGAALIAPYRFIGRASIKGQCQQDWFYGKDSTLDNLLQMSERGIAPLLTRVNGTGDCDGGSLGGLILLCVELYNRTRKAAESAKLWPKNIAVRVLQNAVDRGRLPPPPEPLSEEQIDFPAMPGLLAESTIPLMLEMFSLECKFLKPAPGTFFVTSDNPAVILNEFGHRANRHRPRVGFSQSGFQMLVPLCPSLCICFYDPAVYKCGNRNDRHVTLSTTDTEIVNSLQVQSAEHCLYFHRLDVSSAIHGLVQKYYGLRASLSKELVEIPGSKAGETLLWSKVIHPQLPVRWTFMKFLRYIRAEPGQRRIPEWTEAISRLMQDIRKNPDGPDFWNRLDDILGINPNAPPSSTAGVRHSLWFRNRDRI